MNRNFRAISARRHLTLVRRSAISIAIGCIIATSAGAEPVPGGTLDPTSIPKYVTPLVIPPVMKNNGTTNNYDIAVRQFPQQILPSGFPATTVWSYGPEGDPTPTLAPALNSQFNYPSFTVETTKDVEVKVNWHNDLVVDPDGCKAAKAAGTAATDPSCNFLPHLIPVDRALHWANPEQLTCTDPSKTKDCRPDLSNGGILSMPYDGPVPIIPHVHGAHVQPESDGYPEAWWLPNANNIPLGYTMTGTLVNQYGVPTNTTAGVGNFSYRNDQPSTTLWFHDHTLGMTRNNVYAGPAGFWLIREANGGETGLVSGTLPGPAPLPDETLADTLAQRGKYREIPIVIQDRSFNTDGSLFYPANRAFFEGLGDGQIPGVNGNSKAGLSIDTIGAQKGKNGDVANSDIATMWNPEAFFNVMVVNGVAWPKLEVAQSLYRFRLLNGCNSRFLNLAMYEVNPDGTLGKEVPFYMIGAEQSLMPNVVKVTSGFRTLLPGGGAAGVPTPAASTQTALLMGLAERADVLVDFRNLSPGVTMVRMVNTAPDAPYGGFPDVPADPDTTGQIMQFVVNTDLNLASDASFTAPEDLVLSLPDPTDAAADGVIRTGARDLALIEEESILICAKMSPNGNIQQDNFSIPDPLNPGTCIDAKKGTLAKSVPFAPKAAVLGVNGAGGGTTTLWADPIETMPALDATETWELWNFTEDAHPLHVHLVKFKVVNREPIDPDTGLPSGAAYDPELTEIGWKDTVIAYPGEVTRLNATFDIEGLYVWHCHILEHEDNEMMVPFCVGDTSKNGCNAVPIATAP